MTHERFMEMVKYVLARNEEEGRAREALKHYKFNVKINKK